MPRLDWLQWPLLLQRAAQQEHGSGAEQKHCGTGQLLARAVFGGGIDHTVRLCLRDGGACSSQDVFGLRITQRFNKAWDRSALLWWMVTYGA